MENILAILILLTAIPLGYFLKYLTPEEIKPGKKYFGSLFIGSLLMSVILLFVPFEEIATKKTAVISLFYISLISFISWK